MQDIFRVATDTTSKSEYGLNEQWRFQQSALQKVRGGIQVPNVIAFDFETGLILAAGLKNISNVFECVFENSIIASGEIRLLPVMLEVLEAP
ncbi:hypothetical protein D3C76_1134530 [compost metagenome]